MGLEHHPRIVTTGLALYFDAANTRSYSGSGITVNGLISGVGVTLINGVGFGTTSNGYFMLDGTNDNIPFTVPNFGTTMTIQFWARVKAFNGSMLFGFYFYDIWTQSGGMGYNTAVGDQYGLTSTQVTNLGLTNQWKNYVFEMRSDVSYINNKIYINAQNQSLSQISGTESAANRNFNSGNGRVSSWLYNDSYHVNMDLAQFQIYNKALTAQEILQNYNATKKRYL
jgi:hypothetical protein